MRLQSFEYATPNWILKDIQLQEVNLLVGKNAVGKSKTINSLANAISYILQVEDNKIESDFVTAFIFESGEETILYHFTCVDKKIIDEVLVKIAKEGNRTILLKRHDGVTLLHNEPINPPDDKLVLHVRRDTIQYPYFEKIISWAENVCGHRFNELEYAGDYSTKANISKADRNLYEIVKSLSSESIQRIVNQANQLGYPIEQIVPYEHESGSFEVVIFHEKDVRQGLLFFQLSKGMFRTLYLLIYMEYLASIKKPSLLLVDDLCEGLDYDRSTQLGRMIYDFCIEHDIQLIASSNDSFLMDVVDLKYWNLLQRNGNEVYGINHITHPDLFDDFEFTGLSNFDLFSSDYIARHLNRKLNE